MNLFKEYTAKDGFTALVKPGKDGIEFLEMGVLRLAPGGKYRGSTDGSEVCLVLLGGLANVTAGQADFHSIGGRANVFAGRATAVHVPPGFKFKVEAVGALEAAIARVPSDLQGEPRLIGPEKVKVNVRGKDTFERQVHDIIDVSFPSKRLLVGETFNMPGKWSSYPPHKHDRMAPPEETRMEEVYFFKVNPPQGFGFQRVYSPDRKVDEAFVIRDNTLTKLPFGYHPTVAAPGYSLYYLWVLAGEPRNYILHDDPEHKWVKDA
ncbi:MAG: 5-deoxy-glucuronate isomerase [Candidatus Methylomirabilota bacterium]